MKSQTFDFGFGAVPAHQHPNGGGWVANTASVEVSVYVGPDAQVSGKCSRSPLCISGYEYSVTVCDDLISVGCQTAPLEKWASGWAPEKALLLERSRELLLSLAELHQRSVNA